MAFTIALLLAGIAGGGPSSAQSWLDDAKKTLEGVTGGAGGSSDSGGGTGLSSSEIGGGLKEALRLATERTVDTVGVEDGFNADPAIHIPLPKSLQTVQSALRQVGMADMADDVELRLNRAAEAAAPEAKAVFFDSISQMTWQDAEQILNGPDDAATQYFRRTMSDPLKGRMRPIVDDQLAQVGAIQSYDAMMGEYDSIPFVPDVKADLTDYTLDEALDGIFHYLGKEEAAIRQNPAARTTDLLKKVFGG